MPNEPKPRSGISPETRRIVVLVLWAILICCVVIGSLLPAASPLIIDPGRLHLNDKVMHGSNYLALSLLSVVGFKEAGQDFSPGRAMELGDLIANGIGVSFGVLFAFPIPYSGAGSCLNV